MTKQVIVIRKDLKMRRGKEIAQGAHASMAFLTKKLCGVYPQLSNFQSIEISTIEREWINNSFKKVCVRVNSEEELQTIHSKALNAGLISHLIIDSGLTEFDGAKTATCCAIGPDLDEKIDKITGYLELY